MLGCRQSRHECVWPVPFGQSLCRPFHLRYIPAASSILTVNGLPEVSAFKASCTAETFPSKLDSRAIFPNAILEPLPCHKLCTVFAFRKSCFACPPSPAIADIKAGDSFGFRTCHGNNISVTPHWRSIWQADRLAYLVQLALST